MKAISEKHKFYVLIIVVCIAGVIGYFRFFRTPSAVGKTSPITNAVASQADVLATISPTTQNNRPGMSKKEAPHRHISRNIFEPAGPLPAEVLPKPTKTGHATNLDMTLSGTIIGTHSSIAIINNQFMRRGQHIEECEILRIAPDRVYLGCGNEERILDVISTTPLITE